MSGPLEPSNKNAHYDELILRVRTGAWNLGIKDGWDRQPPRELPEDLANLNDAAINAAWQAEYLAAFREGRETVVPFAD